MFTRSQYNKLAAVIQTVRQNFNDDPAYDNVPPSVAIDDVAFELGMMFEKDNDDFDMGRWLEATM